MLKSQVDLEDSAHFVMFYFIFIAFETCINITRFICSLKKQIIILIFLKSLRYFV
jgi:hypothetical protein